MRWGCWLLADSVTGSSLQHGDGGELRLGGASLEVRVPASQKRDVSLVLTEADRSQLLAPLQQGQPSCVELVVELRGGGGSGGSGTSAPAPSALSMWVRDSPGSMPGRLVRQFIEGESSFRVQLLASHTQGFVAGAYRLSIDGGLRDSRVSFTMLHSLAPPRDGSGGWATESLEQARDRLQRENAELQALVEKQKEFILILKRKFLEKGDALMDSQNEVLLQKAKRAKFIINTWRMKTVVPAFAAWRTYAQTKKARKKELLGKVVARLGNSQLWRAWRTWVHLVEGQKIGGLKAALAAEKGPQHTLTHISSAAAHADL